MLAGSRYLPRAFETAKLELADALVESVRAMAAVDETNRWLTLATSLCQQAVFELETHAIVVDGRIEAGDLAWAEAPKADDFSLAEAPFRCQPLETLEVLEVSYPAPA